MLALLLTATLIPAVPTASADVCGKYGICPIVRAGEDYACAGLGFGTQGIVTCVDAGDQCWRLLVGFNREEVCVGAIVLP